MTTYSRANALHDPFRSPDWRWQVAQALVDHDQTVAVVSRDAWLKQAVGLVRALKVKVSIPSRGALPRALALFLANDWPRWELEARVLAGETLAAISRKLELPTRVVRAYEACFFQDRDRLRYRGYIVHLVLGDRYHAGMTLTDVDLLLKHCGYFHGPMLLDKLLRHVRTPLVLSTDLAYLSETELQQQREDLLFQLGLLALTLPISRTTLRQAALLRSTVDHLEQASHGRCREGTKLILPHDMESRTATSPNTAGDGEAAPILQVQAQVCTSVRSVRSVRPKVRRQCLAVV